MSLSDENNQQIGDSIFSGEHYVNPPMAPQNVPPPPKSSSFVSNFVEKFIIPSKNVPEAGPPQNQVQKIIEENKETFEMLIKCNCSITMAEDGVIVEYPDLDMQGKMTIKEDGSGEFDENAMKIFEHIAQLLVRTENLENGLDNYESDEFYPIGELINDKITYKGKELDVMAGMLVNPKGETKKVYFYHGKEITPDEQ